MEFRKWSESFRFYGNMKFRQRIIFCTIVVAIFGPFFFWKLRHSEEGFPVVHRSSHYDVVNDAYFDLNGKTHWHAVVKRVRKQSEETRPKITNIMEKIESEAPTNKSIKSSLVFNRPVSREQNPWKVWSKMVTSRAVTPEGDTNDLHLVLKGMKIREITAAGVGFKGTQLKATLYLEGNQRVIFKPMRYPRDFIVEGTPYAGFDRHNAEIAAFHLDRILGFYRAPPVVGRRINLATEIEPVADSKLLKTFFTENANRCFYGVCYYCKKAEAACAEGNIMEGSMTIWLPEGLKLKNWRHPWMRTYRKNKKAKWEVNNQYCKDVVKKAPYDKGAQIDGYHGHGSI